MDFMLDKKHEMARTLFREFAENEVKPLAQDVDETERFPKETVEKMAKYGFYPQIVRIRYVFEQALSALQGRPLSVFLTAS